MKMLTRFSQIFIVFLISLFFSTDLLAQYLASNQTFDDLSYAESEVFHLVPETDSLPLLKHRKNSVWLGIMTLNYGRFIPFTNGKSGMSLSGGISFLDGPTPFIQIESTLLFGDNRHFFEPGIFYFTDYNDNIFLVRVGYRYQSDRGFLIRVAPLFTYVYEFTVLPSVCIGYSF